MKPSDYIREQRLAIDKIYNSFGLIHSSAEITLAKRCVELSKMWFGEVLGIMNETNPYPESSNPENKVIEAQADHTENTFHRKFIETESRLSCSLEDLPDLTKVSRVKSLREELVNMFNSIEKQAPDFVSSTGYMHQFFKKGAYKLIEAKMWLGRELNRIREEKQATQTV